MWRDRAVTETARRLTPASAHLAISSLERHGAAVELDLGTPSLRTAAVIQNAQTVAPAEDVIVPAQDDIFESDQRHWASRTAWRLQDSIMDVDSGLVFSRDRVITQSSGPARTARDGSFLSGATYRVRRTDPVSVPYPIAGLGDTHHHYHFMIETLPRLLHARAVDPAVRFVTSAEINETYRDVLRTLDLPVETFGPGTVIRSAWTVVVEPSPWFWPRPSDVRVLQHAFPAVAHSSGEYPDVIYVGRQGSTRALENEDWLASTLQELGFVTPVLHRMPVSEQIEVFRRARVVVGPHGAGLSGIAFMAPGSHVVEITSGDLFEHCYRRLAAAAGLDYTLCHVNGTMEAPAGRAADALAMLRPILDHIGVR